MSFKSAISDYLAAPIKPVGQLAAPPAQIAPHKAGKPTSYSASGLAATGVPPPDTSPEGGSSQPSFIQELVPELVSPTQRRIAYARMLNDAGVDVSVRAIKTPVLGSEFFMEPYSDDPNDQLVADFVTDNLMGGMSAPFINSLEDILHFFEDGYSVLEKCYELRSWSPAASGANSKMYTMLKKLGVRPESTLSDIGYDDNGGPLLLKQQARKADNSIQEVELPIAKLLIFTFGRRGGDIRGKSILRTAYSHWYYKTHLYKIDAIQKERHSLGIPIGRLLPGFTVKDQAIMRQMLRNLRNNEESFALLTPTVDIEFAEIKGNLVNVMESVEHHHVMIMLNVMAQFLYSATHGGSGRANGATQVDMFMKALRYIANYVADVINMYLIPELVVWNFPTTNFPRLKVRNIGETKDAQMLAAAFANLLSQGGITADLATENWFRRTFDLPLKTQQEWDLQQQQAQAADNAAASQNGNGNGNQRGAIKPNAIKPGNTGKSPSSPN